MKYAVCIRSYDIIVQILANRLHTYIYANTRRSIVNVLLILHFQYNNDYYHVRTEKKLDRSFTKLPMKNKFTAFLRTKLYKISHCYF